MLTSEVSGSGDPVLTSLIGHCSLRKHNKVHIKLVIFHFFVADDASGNLHLSFLSLNLKHFDVLKIFFTVGGLMLLGNLCLLIIILQLRLY